MKAPRAIMTEPNSTGWKMPRLSSHQPMKRPPTPLPIIISAKAPEGTARGQPNSPVIDFKVTKRTLGAPWAIEEISSVTITTTQPKRTSILPALLSERPVMTLSLSSAVEPSPDDSRPGRDLARGNVSSCSEAPAIDRPLCAVNLPQPAGGGGHRTAGPIRRADPAQPIYSLKRM